MSGARSAVLALGEAGVTAITVAAELGALVRQQVGWGDSTRAVGAAAGLSHTHVQRLAAGETDDEE